MISQSFCEIARRFWLDLQPTVTRRLMSPRLTYRQATVPQPCCRGDVISDFSCARK